MMGRHQTNLLIDQIRADVVLANGRRPDVMGAIAPDGRLVHLSVAPYSPSEKTVIERLFNGYQPKKV